MSPRQEQVSCSTVPAVTNTPRRRHAPTTTLPDDLAEEVRAMRAVEPVPGDRSVEAAKQKEALDMRLLALWEQGWSGPILARSIGTTREMVSRRLARARVRRDPDVTGLRGVSWQRNPITPDPELVQQLQLAQQGGEDVLWGAVARAREEGVSLQHVASALGVSRSTVQWRLSMCGHRPMAPSVAAKRAAA